MLRIITSLVALGVAPVLLFLAWRGWAERIRKELPPWRNGFCISALLLLSLNLLGTVILELPVLVGFRTMGPLGLMEGMLTLSHTLSCIVIVLALSFRGAPRVLVIVAGLLMLFSWPVGYV